MLQSDEERAAWLRQAHRDIQRTERMGLERARRTLKRDPSNIEARLRVYGAEATYAYLETHKRGAVKFPVIYEMDAIGVGGALEAVATFRYCSIICRANAIANWGEPLFATPKTLGEEESPISDEHCDWCDKPLERV